MPQRSSATPALLREHRVQDLRGHPARTLSEGFGGRFQDSRVKVHPLLLGWQRRAPSLPRERRSHTPTALRTRRYAALCSLTSPCAPLADALHCDSLRHITMFLTRGFRYCQPAMVDGRASDQPAGGDQRGLVRVGEDLRRQWPTRVEGGLGWSALHFFGPVGSAALRRRIRSISVASLQRGSVPTTEPSSWIHTAHRRRRSVMCHPLGS